MMLLEQDPLCTSLNEESGPLANNVLLTGYEPNFFDDFHYSETTENFLHELSSLGSSIREKPKSRLRKRAIQDFP